MNIICNDCERTAHKRVPKGSTVLGLTMHLLCPECQTLKDCKEYGEALVYKYTAITGFGTFRANDWGSLWLKVNAAAPKGRIGV